MEKQLDALQFVVSAITVRSIGYRYPVVVDVEDIRTANVRSSSRSRSSANQAANQHRSVRSFAPLTPYERRIVISRCAMTAVLKRLPRVKKRSSCRH